MDAVSLLEKDHRTVDRLLEQAKTDAGVVSTLEQEITAHATVEEEIFYPEVRKALAKEGREMVRESLQEHEEITEALHELGALDEDDRDEYASRLEELKEKIQHHVKEEEGEMFPQVRETMSRDQLGELGSRMEARKEELKGALVPA